METLNRQQVYEKVREFFSRPGAVFGYSGSMCVYRGDGDPLSPVRCAIGCLLPDNLYDDGMENTGAEEVYNGDWHNFDDSGNEYEGYGIGHLFDPSDEGMPYFLSEMQEIHDGVARRLKGGFPDATMELFITNLDIFAKDNDLQVVNA